MRFLRAAGLALFFSIVTAAPSFAATYAWPLQVAQQLSITNLSLPASTKLALYCYYGAKNATFPIAEGNTAVPATQSANGVFTYSGTLAITLQQPNGFPGLPLSGNIISCGLRANGGATTIGAASTLTLP